MKKFILLLAIFSVFVFFGNSFADTLYLKNGSQIIGRTIKQDAEKVLFKIGGEEDGVEVTFFAEEILRIDKAEVSSFITLPFGEDKQIDIPRPIFETEPMLTEQARTQLEKQPKADKEEKIKTQLENLPKVAESDLFLKQKEITEELTLLLDEEELNYFSRINSEIKSPTDKMIRILTNPQALTQGSDKLMKTINEMPSELEGIIKQLNSLQAPALFANFHQRKAI